MAPVFLPMLRLPKPRMLSWSARLHVIAFAAFALSGANAGASPPPEDALASANAALTAAATPEGDRYAPDELAAAHRQLDAAQVAMARHDFKNARELAEQAQADADLARAKTHALAARATINAKTQDNAELQHRLLDQEPLEPQPAGPGSVQRLPIQLGTGEQAAAQQPGLTPAPPQQNPVPVQQEPVPVQQEPVPVQQEPEPVQQDPAQRQQEPVQ